ncbi:MAG TPA: hypothetical protein PKN48_07600 [Bacteroidales bacterium]|mgnify:CR=1 FL=1|nr:hypothetical protein [Bacteroidales bacterium]
MRKVFFLLNACVFMVSLLVSCKKETPPDDNDIDITTSHGVFIVNEGNFQWSNASVTYYNFSNNDYKEDIFKDVNNRPLGDVAQSVRIHNGKAYIVVNNSNKIEIVNLSDFASCGVISGLVSPRYFLPVDASKAYVSDLYSNNISIIDLNNNTITGTIPCHGSTEEMLLTDTLVVVTNTRTDKVYFINTITDDITDSIQVGFASNSLHLDKNGRLWVMCAGDVSNSINASLYRIDVAQKLVEQTFQLSTPLNIWDKMGMNLGKDTIYYMCNGIYRMPVSAAALPGEVFIPQGSSIFHGLAVNPVNNTLFVADAVDYVQKGKVNYYSSGGTLLGSINTGIIPVDFYFY